MDLNSIYPLTFVKAGFIEFIIFSFLYYTGLGLTNLVVREEKRERLLLLTPFIGIGFSLTIFESLGILGYQIWISVVILLFTSSLMTIISLWRKPLHWARVRPSMPYAVGAFLVVWLVSSVPLLFQENLIPIGENADAVTYSVRAEYLAVNGYRPPEPTHAFHPIVAAMMFGHSRRAGDVYLLGAINTLTGTDPFAAFSPLINTAFGLSLLGIVYLGWTVFGLASGFRWLLFTLASFNSTLLWGSYDGFLSQQMVIGQLLVCMASFYELLTGPKLTSRIRWEEITIFSTIFSSIFSLYPESLTLFLLILFIVFFYWILRNSRRILLVIGICFFLILLINPIGVHRWITSYQAITSNHELSSKESRMVSGNIRYFSQPHELFGLTPHLSNLISYRKTYLSSIPFQIATDTLLLTSVVTILFGIKFSNAFQKIIFISILFSVSFHLIFFYFWGWFYGYMKIVFLGAGFFETILAASFNRLLSNKSKYKRNISILKYCISSFIAVIVFLHFLSSVKVVHAVTANRQSAQSYFRELSYISSWMGQGGTIYLPNEPPSLRLAWFLYFLRGQQIYVDESPGYFPVLSSTQLVEPPDFVLIAKSWVCEPFPNIDYCQRRERPADIAGDAMAKARQPFGHLSHPPSGATVQGAVMVDGWVLDPQHPALRVTVVVDGEEVAYNPVIGTHFGVCLAFRDVPHCLFSHFRFIWNTATVADGPHMLAVHVTYPEGDTAKIGEHPITVLNSAPRWAFEGSKRSIVPVFETEKFLVFAGKDL